MIAVIISLFSLIVILLYIHYDLKRTEMQKEAFELFRETTFEQIKALKEIITNINDYNDGED